MKSSLSCCLILITLSSFSSLKAQLILAGRHDTSDYYQQHTISIPTAQSSVDSIDINNDGNFDFEFYAVSENGGNGSTISGCSIFPLNNSQVSWTYLLDTCTSGGNTNVSQIQVVKSHKLNDTISNKILWLNNSLTLSNAITGYGGNPCSSYGNYNSFNDSGYIGVRVFVNTDTLYGWIKVSNVTYSSLVLQAYACGHRQATGINGIQDQLMFNLFPNPAQTALSVIITAAGKYFLGVTTVLGEALTEKQFEGTKTQLDVFGLPGGIYFLRICDDRGRCEVRKILVQR